MADPSILQLDPAPNPSAELSGHTVPAAATLLAIPAEGLEPLSV